MFINLAEYRNDQCQHKARVTWQDILSFATLQRISTFNPQLEVY